MHENLLYKNPDYLVISRVLSTILDGGVGSKNFDGRITRILLGFLQMYWFILALPATKLIEPMIEL